MLCIAAFTTAASAATVSKLSDDALAPLRGAKLEHTVHLDRLMLREKSPSVIDLEEFQLWAPNGKVLIHGDNGVTAVDPPNVRYYRGLVDGDVDSFAYFAVDMKTKRVDGLVVKGDAKYSIAADRRPGIHPLRDGEEEPVDYFLTTFDETDSLPTRAENWSCLARVPDAPPEDTAPRPLTASPDAKLGAPETHGITGTQSYAISVELESDYEMYVAAGSSADNVTTYLTNLSGQVATIYKRDLNIEMTLKAVNVYSSASDPWSSTGLNGLYQLGDLYHNAVSKPSGRTTSAVVFLGAVNYPGGIAWEGVIGESDFSQSGHYGGPYAWCGLVGTGGLGTVPNPDTTVNGTLYGLPTGQQNYWPLIEYAHELGHVLAGHHTHCVELTAGEASSTGRSFVDQCYSGEYAGTGNVLTNCFGGTSARNVGSETVPTEKGTIMSYCHNKFVASVPQSRYTFGLSSEVSKHQYDDYMLRSPRPVQYTYPDGRGGGYDNIVSSVSSFSMSAITAPASVAANSTGNAASATAAGGTFTWAITNGTITGGQGTSAITFTAGATGTVTLRATAVNGQRVGFTDTKNVTINSVSFDPPASVVATATGSTSVEVSWASVPSATEYRVYRASTMGSFVTLVGSTASTTLTDNTAVANTSYQYVVTAGDGVTFSTNSVADIATTVVFTDSVLTAASVKLTHVDELLTAVNALRTLTGLTAISFTAPAPAGGVTVRKTHVDDLRTGVTAARSALGLSTSFAETITAASTTVKTSHVTELRDTVK